MNNSVPASTTASSIRLPIVAARYPARDLVPGACRRTNSSCRRIDDHELTDPIPDQVDLILVQYREPTMRALSNFELRIDKGNVAPTRAYHEFWLAVEAYYAIRFWHKWAKSEIQRRRLLSYEELTADPRAVVESILKQLLDEHIPASFAPKRFVLRSLRQSRFFDETLHRQFAYILTKQAENMGYPPWCEPTPDAGGRVVAIYAALRSFHRGEYRDCLTIVEPLVNESTGHAAIDCLFVNALAAVGLTSDAIEWAEASRTKDPSWGETYVFLAHMRRHNGEIDAARQIISEGLSRAHEPDVIRKYLSIHWMEEMPK